MPVGWGIIITTSIQVAVELAWWADMLNSLGGGLHSVTSLLSLLLQVEQCSA